MKRLLLLVVPALFIFLGSCSKLDSKKHFTLNPEFVAYFKFNKGSQWKYYEQSDTTLIETAVATDLVEGKMVWDAFDQEFIQYDVESDLPSHYKIRAVADENEVTKATFFVLDSFYRIGAQWYYSNGNFNAVANTGDSLRVLPTYTTGGKTYNSVLELKPANSDHFKTMHIAKNIGIIRKELKSGKTFILKSYQLQ